MSSEVDFSPKHSTAVSLEQMESQSLDLGFWGLQGNLIGLLLFFILYGRDCGLFSLANLIIYSFTCSFHFFKLMVTLYHLMLTLLCMPETSHPPRNAQTLINNGFHQTLILKAVVPGAKTISESFSLVHFWSSLSL